MRLYEAFLQEPDELNPTISAISPGGASQQEAILKNIVVLKIGEGMALPVRYDTPALILCTGTHNILLGYFDPSDKYRHVKRTVADGDMFLTCGNTRGLRTSDDGTIEIVNMCVRDDGEIITTPLMSFNKDNELTIKMEKLIIDMYGANSGGNIVWTQNKVLGFNTFITNYKTSNKDLGPRIYHKIEGTPFGPSIKYTWDVTPAPVGAVMPQFTESAIPLSMQINMNPSSPLDVKLMAMSAPIFSMNLSPIGDLEVEHSISKAKIGMSAAGEISIESAAGTSKITMSPAGIINIDAKAAVHINAVAGYEIKGKQKGLLSTLIAFVQQYLTHTHCTGTGPSGPPITAGSTASGPAAVLQIMKG